jgi:Fibronectin type III domain
MILLAVSATAALAAGIVWGMVTSGGTTTTPTAQPSATQNQVVPAPPFPTSVQNAYRPLNVTVTPGTTTDAVVSWSPPANASDISGYIVDYSLFGVSQKPITVSVAEHSARLTGLTAGQHYEITVSSLVLLPGDPAEHLAMSDPVGFDTASVATTNS